MTATMICCSCTRKPLLVSECHNSPGAWLAPYCYTMHERDDGAMQASVTWRSSTITDWIDEYKAEHNASDSQAIKYALRQQAQADLDQ